MASWWELHWCPSILSGFVCPCRSSSRSCSSFVFPPGGSLSRRAPLGVRAVVVLELGTQPSCWRVSVLRTHSEGFLGCFQVGETRGSSGQVLLRGPQHPDHHVAAPHGRVRQELRAVAVAAQPAARGHATLQPEVSLPGESWGWCWWGLTWLLMVSPGLPRSHRAWEGACRAVWGLCHLRAVPAWSSQTPLLPAEALGE